MFSRKIWKAMMGKKFPHYLYIEPEHSKKWRRRVVKNIDFILNREKQLNEMY